MNTAQVNFFPSTRNEVTEGEWWHCSIHLNFGTTWRRVVHDPDAFPEQRAPQYAPNKSVGRPSNWCKRFGEGKQNMFCSLRKTQLQLLGYSKKLIQFNRRMRFCSNLMSPRAITCAQVLMYTCRYFFPSARFGISRQIFKNVPTIILYVNLSKYQPRWYMRKNGRTREQSDNI